MRVVVEIVNDCIDCIYADEACDVLVIHRDELAEELLPDGQPGYASGWDASVDPQGVEEAFKFAGLVPS